jgi:RHS repeat-associated protein
VDALNGQTTFGYDGNGNLLTVTDARGNTTSHTYDSMDRLSTRTDPLNRQEFYQYDPNGNPTQFTDRKNQVSTFAYDGLNRRTRATYADGTFTEFAYDGAGRVLTATDSVTGTITEEYDLLDRLLRETTPQGTIQYAYDALGRRTIMTVNGQPPVSYGYDAASRLTQILQAPLNPVTLQYDAAGRRTLLILPNGVSTAYDYDLASRLTQLTYTGPSGPLGNLTYQYDASGNRVGVGGSFARTLLPEAVPGSAYDAANQQLALGEKAMAYDQNGNLVTLAETGSTITVVWDARNRLVALSGPAVSGASSYDARGRRVRKETNGAATIYQYDGQDIVTETLAGSSTGYLHGPQPDEPLVRGTSEFYLRDALGSTLALSDPTGSLTTRYTYEPFGRSQADGPASPNPFQFTGREHDGSLGLYHYRLRVYSPSQHRFLSQDPLGLLGGTNAYRYVFNNPVRLTDPWGLDVTVTLYKGQGGNLAGHMGIRVGGGSSFGLTAYPSTWEIISILRGKDTQGIVEVVSKNEVDQAITIRTSPDQDEAMKKVLDEALADPVQRYNLYYRNCAQFVQEVLEAGRVMVPNTRYPHDLMNYLQWQYGRGRRVAVPPFAHTPGP